MIKIKKSQLKSGWLWSVPRRSKRISEPALAPPAEPRYSSFDPAFGNFNLPLDRPGGATGLEQIAIEDASDVECLRESLEQDEFESYEDFRRDELGL